VEEAAVAPWDPRLFPLTDEEVADLEESDSRPMPPPALHQLPAQSSATVSAETSRASSRYIHLLYDTREVHTDGNR
jgi:hypothetical protein